MNKYMKPNPWREIHERRGGVLGDDLKCAKGRWTLNGEPARDGLQICILMPTARHGERQYREGAGAKYRGMQLYINGRRPTSGSSSAGSLSRSSRPSPRTKGMPSSP